LSIAFTVASNAAFCPKPAPFFASPQPSGRRIVCGFSYLQRIGKGATTDLWFPASLCEDVAARVLAGDTSVLDKFHVEWAAVRQFELLQEAGNLAIEDLEFMDFKRAFLNLMKMRAGGYRVTVITLGRYDETGEDDDLRILDARLQDEITRLIHMLYLEEESALLSGECAGSLERGAWRYAEALPHVAMTLGAAQLFGKAAKDRNSSLKAHFFRILDLLPQRHLVHDVAVGLTLPDASKEKNWVYLAKGEHQFPAYMRMLSGVFSSFDCVSLSGLHERANAASEVMPVMHHLRGYGDRLRPEQDGKNRAMAAFLRPSNAR
jgi:hypothetical protein